MEQRFVFSDRRGCERIGCTLFFPPVFACVHRALATAALFA
jgi:hypothetical protein